MMRRLLLLLLIGGLLWTLPAQATILFQDGFENTITASGWTTDSCAYMVGYPDANGGTVGAGPWPEGCNPMRSTDYAHSGSYSLKGNYNGPLIPDGGTGTKGGWITHQETHQLKEWWYRVYILTTPDIVYIPGANVKQVYEYSGPTNYPSFVWERQYGDAWVLVTGQGVDERCPTGTTGGTCVYQVQTQIVPAHGTWACYEFHLKYNTPGVANGLAEIFVNGQQTLGYYNRTFITPVGQTGQFGNFGDTSGSFLDRFKIITQGGLSSGKIYYDDFAFGDSRIGCAGAPPPAAPTGLTIH